MAQTLGSVVKRSRIAKDLSQRELALQIGVGNSTVARIERGEPAVPDVPTLQKLSVALDIDYYLLLFLNGMMDDEPDMRLIHRAMKYLEPSEKSRMMQILELSFPSAFEKARHDLESD